jgi:SAM-dependent methyltransferase
MTGNGADTPARAALARWAPDEVLPPSLVARKRVLVWQCGRGEVAALFAELGAASVFGIDVHLDAAAVPASLRELPTVRFARAGVDDLVADGAQHEAYDLVFANAATQHAAPLPGLLCHCYRLLSPGGRLVLIHDNYYQPVGSHDHGLLGYDASGAVAFQGPRCWDAEEKCAASADFRRGLREHVPWTWDEWTDLQISPDDCRRCPYYRRARPWAHLLYQEEFRQVFPQPFFTGRPWGLNKATPFQLRQWLIEAGFDVERWVPCPVPATPPAELLGPPFNLAVDDLCTASIAIRCARGPLASYHLVGA